MISLLGHNFVERRAFCKTSQSWDIKTLFVWTDRGEQCSSGLVVAAAATGPVSRWSPRQAAAVAGQPERAGQFWDTGHRTVFSGLRLPWARLGQSSDS